MWKFLRRKTRSNRATEKPSPEQIQKLSKEELAALSWERFLAKREAHWQERERKADSLRLSFQGSISPEKMQELKDKVAANMCELGYLPPDDAHEFWWKPEVDNK